jgi:hypothetical protein
LLKIIIKLQFFLVCLFDDLTKPVTDTEINDPRLFSQLKLVSGKVYPAQSFASMNLICQKRSKSAMPSFEKVLPHTGIQHKGAKGLSCGVSLGER